MNNSTKKVPYHSKLLNQQSLEEVQLCITDWCSAAEPAVTMEGDRASKRSNNMCRNIYCYARYQEKRKVNTYGIKFTTPDKYYR